MEGDTERVCATRPVALAPTISVLIPTRNRPDKVRRAVESVLVNSFRDFELIVVDQSTNRSTEEALAAIDDSRLRYISTTTTGVAISRNMLVRLSRAEIVAFTDDDCVCSPDWLSSVLAEFMADPEALAVYGRVIPHGPPRDGRICPCINESTQRRVLEEPAIPAIALGGGNNMSFRKEIFRKAGLFVESLGAGTALSQGEDTEFSYRILWSRFRVIYSPMPLVRHDKWLSRAEFAVLMKTSVRASALIFFSYALRLDKLAFTELLRTFYYLARNRLATGSASIGLFYFVMGLMIGPRYLFVRPPFLDVPK
jgi:glycosyltransferase involved in cell wall biosynthesis